MQLKGLVKFFALALILLSLWQLSHTFFVRSHESEIRAKAHSYIKKTMPTANEVQQKAAEDIRYRRLLDSTSTQSVTWWGTPYNVAKDRELKLGLDLQGGMNVTMEVGLDGLIRTLASNSNDNAFKQSLAQASAAKAKNGSANLITEFVNAYRQKAPNARLAPLFSLASGKRVNLQSTDNEVIDYLHQQSSEAFNNTYNILRNRIDQFGVASPTINKDEAKGVITVELAGVTDQTRVRTILQSSANLQFFELYTYNEIAKELQDVQPLVKDYIKGVKMDSLYNFQARIDSFNKQQADTNAQKNYKKGDLPVYELLSPAQAQRDPATGKMHEFGEIGYTQVKDSGALGEYLRLPYVASRFPANLKFVFGEPNSDDARQKKFLNVYALKMPDATGVPFLGGDAITDAREDFVEGKAAVSMSMNADGSRKWAQMTKKNVGKPVAIVLDEFVRSAPNVNQEITGGNSSISGGMDIQGAKDLSDILKSGKLDAPAKIVQEQIVGPTLGEEAVNGGIKSFTISFLIIFALMLLYYNTSGWVANASLILNLLFTIGILASIGATLTAAGIAALVLTIGMAVDTNVIIFERIKEELGMGRNYQTAVSNGYRRSYAPILDSHVTTFLTAAILFYFGLGPVRGFATTQMIGILLNLFCGILISRLITEWFTDKKKHLQYFTGISRKIFAHAKYKFIEFRKVAYGISVVVLILGIAAIFNGFDQGVEFKGGHSYTIKFDKPMSNEQVASALKPVFGTEPVVKTVETANQLNITTAFHENEKPGANNDSIGERELFKGLKNFLPAGLTYEKFDSDYKTGSQTVQPTISAELKRGATIATLFSILIICLYIFLRFRDWRYSFGTIVALLHDVLVTLAVFSFARKLVPFPLEIDQHFIAAILTVIGFSMNDTIIVFDRIRENTRLMPNAPKGVVINKSINDTLSRTIMTSLTVFLSILVLFIFGGEVTRGFAFAMLIGVIVGTYSSIFVAAPILMDFGRDRPLGSEAPKAELLPAKKKVTI